MIIFHNVHGTILIMCSSIFHKQVPHKNYLATEEKKEICYDNIYIVNKNLHKNHLSWFSNAFTNMFNITATISFICVKRRVSCQGWNHFIKWNRNVRGI